MQLVTGRTCWCIIKDGAFGKRPGRATGAGGEERSLRSVSTRPSPSLGAGPRDARASFGRPSPAPIRSPRAGVQPLGAGTSQGNGSSGPVPKQEPAGCRETEASAATSTRAAPGIHPGSPCGFPPADGARCFLARRRISHQLRPQRARVWSMRVGLL